MNLPRRHVLQITGVSIASIGAGCTSVPSLSSEETRIESLRVDNLDTSEYVVYVLLVDENNPIYYDSVEVEAFDGYTEGREEFEGYPREAGEYTLYVWLEGQSPSEGEQFDVTEMDTCTEVTALINGEGELGLRFSSCPSDENSDS